MRIQIYDEDGFTYQITSQNLERIGQWFSDYAQQWMSANAAINHPIRMDIWPHTPEEFKLCGQQKTIVNQDELHTYIKGLLDMIEGFPL